jgi:ribosomal protein L44E
MPWGSISCSSTYLMKSHSVARCGLEMCTACSCTYLISFAASGPADPFPMLNHCFFSASMAGADVPLLQGSAAREQQRSTSRYAKASKSSRPVLAANKQRPPKKTKMEVTCVSATYAIQASMHWRQRGVHHLGLPWLVYP